MSAVPFELRGVSAVVVGMAIVLVLGLHDLAAKGLWVDEGLSAAIARRDLVSGLTAAWSTPTPGAIALYYAALHVWTLVFGDSESALRLPSVLFAVAGVPIVYLLARRLAGGTAAAIACILLATSPFVLYYTQEARPYTLLVVLSAASSLALLRGIEQFRPLNWAAYGVISTAAVYVHNTAAFVVVGHAVFLIGCYLVRTYGERWWQPTATYVAMAIACLPLAGLFFVPRSAGLDWIEFPTFSSVTFVLKQLAGGTTLLGGIWLVIIGAGVPATLVMVLRGRHRPAAFVLLISIFPIVAELAVSMARPIFIERYLAAAVPGLAILGGLGLAAIPRRLVQGLAIVAVVAASAIGINRGYGLPKEGWREAVAVLNQRARPADGVAVVPEYGRLPFDYYMLRAETAQTMLAIFPTPRWGAYFPALEPGLPLREALGTASTLDRIWIVQRYAGFDPASAEGRILADGLTEFRIADRTDLPDVTVILLERLR